MLSDHDYWSDFEARRLIHLNSLKNQFHPFSVLVILERCPT